MKTRNRYFQVLIGLGLNRIKLNLMSHQELRILLVAAGFIPQGVLMKKLYYLGIKYEGKNLYLKDFNVQLEKKEDGSPFWNIFLETNIVTTKRFLAKLFSSELLGNNNNNNEVDDRLKVYTVSELKKPNREKLFSINDYDFYPGFFNRSQIQVQELYKKEEVKELLELKGQKQFLADI